MSLQPKTHEHISFDESPNSMKIGLIAEDVYESTKLFDTENFNLTSRLIKFETNETSGEQLVRGLDYRQGLTTLNVKAIQELKADVDSLRVENDLLKSELCKKDTYAWC